MKVVTVSVGMPLEVDHDGKRISTGIFKSPANGAVFADRANLEGDGQADLSVHGGRDKALYFYSLDYYETWARELGRPSLEESQFGENLTVSGCRDEEVVIGARLRIGGAEVVVTQPRIPCFKLGIRVGDPTFPNRFWNAGRLGFYARVEQPGFVESGDAITVVDIPDHGITIRELWRSVTEVDRAACLLAMDPLPAIDDGWRKRLRRATATG